MSGQNDGDYEAIRTQFWKKYNVLKYMDVKAMGMLYPFYPPAPAPFVAAAGADGNGKDDKGDCCKVGTLKYFTYCGFGGMLACGITHLLVTPIDLVKCRIQANPTKYPDVFSGFKTTVKETGFRGLCLGWAPTLIGYSMQGSFRFGLYEVFKHRMNKRFSPEFAYKHRTGIYLAAAAGGEFFADLFLSPCEAVKVRMQTQEGFATTMREAIPKIYNNEGLVGFYKGLYPLWVRQIPYTMMKFTSFERVLEFLYKEVVPKPRKDCSKPEQLVVTFTAGYIAGVLCAIISHPADTIVSKLNKDREASLKQILKKVSFLELWTGLGPRILMVGALAGGQWLIYDGIKVWLGIPRPPPPEKPKNLE